MKKLIIIMMVCIALYACEVEIFVNEVKTFYFLLSVFILQDHVELTTAHLTVYVNSELFYSTELEAKTNTIVLREDQDNYLLSIEKLGYQSYEEQFTREELEGFGETPLIILLKENP